MLDSAGRGGAERNEEHAVAYVIRALEGTGCATRADFNLDAIVGVSRVVANGWDFERIEPEIFWRIAAEFIR